MDKLQIHTFIINNDNEEPLIPYMETDIIKYILIYSALYLKTNIYKRALYYINNEHTVLMTFVLNILLQIYQLTNLNIAKDLILYTYNLVEFNTQKMYNILQYKLLIIDIYIRNKEKFTIEFNSYLNLIIPELNIQDEQHFNALTIQYESFYKLIICLMKKGFKITNTHTKNIIRPFIQPIINDYIEKQKIFHRLHTRGHYLYDPLKDMYNDYLDTICIDEDVNVPITLNNLPPLLFAEQTRIGNINSNSPAFVNNINNENLLNIELMKDVLVINNETAFNFLYNINYIEYIYNNNYSDNDSDDDDNDEDDDFPI